MSPLENLLDQPDTIPTLDPEGMHQHLAKFPDRLTEKRTLEREPTFSPMKEIPQTLVIAGMGGSGIVGDILSFILSHQTSLHPVVIKDYQLPKHLPEPVFVLCISYSGNTEETISIYQSARERKIPRAIIATEGKLAQLAKADHVSWIPIPKGFPPRAALPYLLQAAVHFLASNRIAYLEDDLTESQAILHKKRREFQPSSRERENPAKQIALKLSSRIPIIAGVTGISAVAAVRWKGQLNENSKLPALTMILPEANHNEIVPLGTMAKGEFPLYLVLLRDTGDSARIMKRLDITKSVVSTHLEGSSEVWSEGNSLLARILSLMYVGDYVSLYTAFLRKVDPTPVPPIDRLKRELSR